MLASLGPWPCCHENHWVPYIWNIWKLKKKYLGSPPEIFDKSVTWDPSFFNWVIIAPALYPVETVLDDLQPLVPTEKPV